MPTNNISVFYAYSVSTMILCMLMIFLCITLQKHKHTTYFSNQDHSQNIGTTLSQDQTMAAAALIILAFRSSCRDNNNTNPTPHQSIVFRKPSSSSNIEYIIFSALVYRLRQSIIALFSYQFNTTCYYTHSHLQQIGKIFIVVESYFFPFWRYLHLRIIIKKHK